MAGSLLELRFTQWMPRTRAVPRRGACNGNEHNGRTLRCRPARAHPSGRQPGPRGPPRDRRRRGRGHPRLQPGDDVRRGECRRRRSAATWQRASPQRQRLRADPQHDRRIDRSNPFFASIGTNGRSCESCHQAAEGWSVTPQGIRARFESSRATDPIFRLNDGANSPRADVSTVHARRAAYSMLLAKGLVRVGLPIPANAQFELLRVDDPYGYASAAELSLFRRPLAATNLRFLSTLMCDAARRLPIPPRATASTARRPASHPCARI